METTQQKIDRLTKELGEAREELMREMAIKLVPRRNVATMLHKQFCRGDHVDSCSWFYESDDEFDGNRDKAHYAEIADRLLKHFSVDQIEKFIGCFQGIRL